MYDLIMKKRNGFALTRDEIRYVISGYTEGIIPDYQMSAFLMAIYFQDMTEEETVALTMAMVESGEQLDLSLIEGIKADKHSTGGVGDKTSLVLGPMVAALGVPVAKMSGRGLGHTGGTIDKLESIKGFTTSLSKEEFIHNVNRMKMAIAGQTANLAPADKKLYALRDVTATVDHLSLIASSIMSKKIAAGADVIVLDVKTGSGAFMKSEEDAFRLAEAMVKIGEGVGKETFAIVSDMDQPLGYAIGNALEVIEAIETLQGHGPKDLVALCLALGSYMLKGVGLVHSEEEGKELLRKTLEDGSAFDKFKEFVKAQRGQVEMVEDTKLLPQAKFVEPLYPTLEGYVHAIRTEDLGVATLILGGGRETKESVIDLAVGLKIHKKIGDWVTKDEPLAYVYANNQDKLKETMDMILSAYTIKEEKPIQSYFIKGFVTKQGIVKN
jgi:pyrimidine-nucleoside phosphorylase